MARRIERLLRSLPLAEGWDATLHFLNRELMPWAKRVQDTTNDHALLLSQVRNSIDFGFYEARPIAASTSLEKLYVWSWTDEKVPADIVTRGVTAPTAQTWKGAGLYTMIFFRHDADQFVQLSHQMPHEWCQTDVRFHVHGIPAANPAGTQYVRWQVDYYFSGNGDALPASGLWTSAANAIAVGTVDEAEYRTIATIPAPSSPGASDMLRMLVTRTGTNAGDTFTTSKAWGVGAANYAVEWFDLHIQKFLAASEEEFSGNIATNPAVIVFDPSYYEGDVYLELAVQSDGGNSCTFDLYNDTDGASVSGTETSTTSTTPEIKMLGPLTLPTGAKKYWVRGKYDATADEPKLFKARFVARLAGT